jgi:signal recognition particle GTPase
MTTFNWIILATTLLGWAVTYGKFCQKVNQIDKDVTRVDTEINELHRWGENEIVKAKKEREEALVSKDVFVEVINEFRRRIDEVNIIELNSRLARIEAQLDSIEITLKSERKP